MNNWVKISSEELEKSKEIIGLKKGDLQILLVKALVKIDKAIEYLKAMQNSDLIFTAICEKELLEILGDKENE